MARGRKSGRLSDPAPVEPVVAAQPSVKAALQRAGLMGFEEHLIAAGITTLAALHDSSEEDLKAAGVTTLADRKAIRTAAEREAAAVRAKPQTGRGRGVGRPAAAADNRGPQLAAPSASLVSGAVSSDNGASGNGAGQRNISALWNFLPKNNNLQTEPSMGALSGDTAPTQQRLSGVHEGVKLFASQMSEDVPAATATLQQSIAIAHSGLVSACSTLQAQLEADIDAILSRYKERVTEAVDRRDYAVAEAIRAVEGTLGENLSEATINEACAKAMAASEAPAIVRATVNLTPVALLRNETPEQPAPSPRLEPFPEPLSRGSPQGRKSLGGEVGAPEPAEPVQQEQGDVSAADTEVPVMQQPEPPRGNSRAASEASGGRFSDAIDVDALSSVSAPPSEASQRSSNEDGDDGEDDATEEYHDYDDHDYGDDATMGLGFGVDGGLEGQPTSVSPIGAVREALSMLQSTSDPDRSTSSIAFLGGTQMMGDFTGGDSREATPDVPRSIDVSAITAVTDVSFGEPSVVAHDTVDYIQPPAPAPEITRILELPAPPALRDHLESIELQRDICMQNGLTFDPLDDEANIDRIAELRAKVIFSQRVRPWAMKRAHRYNNRMGIAAKRGRSKSAAETEDQDQFLHLAPSEQLIAEKLAGAKELVENMNCMMASLAGDDAHHNELAPRLPYRRRRIEDAHSSRSQMNGSTTSAAMAVDAELPLFGQVLLADAVDDNAILNCAKDDHRGLTKKVVGEVLKQAGVPVRKVASQRAANSTSVRNNARKYFQGVNR